MVNTTVPATTNLYFLKSRYYDPTIGRFISQDDESYLSTESINGLNLYAYCLNNPVVFNDNDGNAPKWWEWLLTGLTIAVGVVLCATGVGTALGVGLLVAGGSMLASNIMSVAGVNGKVASIISSALNIVAGVALCFTPFAAIGASMIGSGVGGIAGGFIAEAIGGRFETGAMIGSIVGGILGGQVYKGVQYANIAKQGVTIGKGMDNVRKAVQVTESAVYKPMKGYNFYKKVWGQVYADKLSVAHNKAWITKMIKLDAVIYDAGLSGAKSAGLWYGMELEQIMKYSYKVVKLF